MIARKAGVAVAYARRRQGVVSRGGADEGGVQDFRVGPQDILEPVQPLFQLPAIAGPQAGLLAFPVFTAHRVTATPTTRGLASIAFHLYQVSMLEVDGWL